MTFDEYLEQELNKPPSIVWYNPDGNSSRAVVTRMRKKGLLCALRWECGQVYRDIWSAIKDSWDGWGTPIWWFTQPFILPVFLPLAPFIGTYYRYERALKEYKSEFRAQQFFSQTQSK